MFGCVLHIIHTIAGLVACAQRTSRPCHCKHWTITHVCTRKHQGLSIQETTAFLHHTANQHEEQSAKPGNVDEEVVETLAALGLLRYQAVFEREEIRARNLPDLTTEDLAELVGVLGGG